MEMEGLKV
jgi:hypothetical protein